MMEYLISLLSTTYMMSAYVCLLPNRMKPIHYIVLFSYLFSYYTWFDSIFGQWGTLLIIALNCTIIYFGTKRNLFDILLCLTGHLLLIFANHLITIPSNLLGLSLVLLRETHAIPALLLSNFIIIILLRALRKHYLLPRLHIFASCSPKLLKVIIAGLLLSLSLLTINFVYGEATGYPTEVLSWNGIMISALIVVFMLIFYAMYDIMKSNYELQLQQAQTAIMQDYTQHMESIYADLRIFRHDYKQILSTLHFYIDNGDLPALKEFYCNKILNYTDPFSDDSFSLGKLHLIEDMAVKSLLYTKLLSISNKKLPFTLELAEPVPLLPVDSLSLCRVLGILIDNAIEAARDSEEKQLRIAVFPTNTAVVFIIANSTPPLQTPLAQLSQPGYSSKPNHEGLGLASVARILRSLPQAALTTQYENGIFRQTLEIELNYLSKK